MLKETSDTKKTSTEKLSEEKETVKQYVLRQLIKGRNYTLSFLNGWS